MPIAKAIFVLAVRAFWRVKSCSSISNVENDLKKLGEQWEYKIKVTKRKAKGSLVRWLNSLEPWEFFNEIFFQVLPVAMGVGSFDGSPLQ